MRTDATRPTSRGLSCYTESLAGYLAARAPARASRTARSVRLAVNPATGCFSHHDRALKILPGGRRLAYRGAPDAEVALTGIAAELASHGRVLVVAAGGALPRLSGAAAHAPHLMLVDGPPEGGWRVVDGFTALFSGGGHQEPFAGEFSAAELRALLAFPRRLSEVPRARNALALGFPVPTPVDDTYQSLAEEHGTTTEHLPDEPWLTGSAALEETAGPVLAGLQGDGERGVLEDVWAAAHHHMFRDALPLAADAAACRPRLRRTHGTHRRLVTRRAGELIAVPTSTHTLWDRFARTAARHPDRPALVAGTTALTCAQLRAHTESLAARLTADAPPPSRIALLAERTPATYAASLAVQRFGGAVVPLNPAAPPGRNETVVRQVDAALVLADATGDTAPAGRAAPLLPVALTDPADAPDLRGLPGPHDAGYILFTLGSTGLPKRVVIRHTNTDAYLDHSVERSGAGPDSRLSQTFGPSFAPSVFDMFVAWSTGAALVVPSADDLMYPAGFVRRHRLTHWVSLVVEAVYTGDAPDPAPLLAALQEWLPAYMVPHTVLCLPELPVNLNGKTYRKAIQATLSTASPAVYGLPRPTPKGPPATGTHRTSLPEGTR